MVSGRRRAISARVQFDDFLVRYFGTPELEAVSAGVLNAGVERMRVDLGMERDRDRRFALWAALHMLGAAPDLDIAFKDLADRDAARNFMEAVEKADEPGSEGEEL